MKKLLISLFVSLTLYSTVDSQNFVHFQEDFNSGNSSPFFSNQTIYATPPWKIGRPAINDFTGTGIAYFNDDSVGTNSNGYNHADLISIPFDNTIGLKSYVEFDYNMRSTSANDSLYLETVGFFPRTFPFLEMNDNCGVWNSPGCVGNYPRVKVDISQFRDTLLQLKIGYTSGFTGTSGYVGIDNLIVYADTSNYINSNLNTPMNNDFTPTIISGSTNWQLVNRSNSIDNTPMYYFDDDSLGSNSINNTVALTSNTFDNTQTTTSYLEFDYNYDDVNGVTDSFYVEVYDGTNWVNVFTRVTDDCGSWTGPGCANGFPRASIDISSYANQNCQVRFIYHDGNDWSGFVAIDNIVVSPNVTVGAKEINQETAKLDVFPNPSNGLFEIRTQSEMIGKQYQILDISGKVVQVGRIDRIKQQINLCEVHEGIYFLRIPQSGVTKKIVRM
jgi:hypothetical protein